LKEKLEKKFILKKKPQIKNFFSQKRVQLSSKLFHAFYYRANRLWWMGYMGEVVPVVRWNYCPRHYRHFLRMPW